MSNSLFVFVTNNKILSYFITLGTINEIVSMYMLKNFIRYLLLNDYKLSDYYLVVDNSKTLVSKVALKYYEFLY